MRCGPAPAPRSPLALPISYSSVPGQRYVTRAPTEACAQSTRDYDMSEWGTGYVDEIPYTYGYCDELNPLRLNLALLRAGLALPAVHTACELGFGHGVSVNIHAAGSVTRWHGTDFNPVHANFAQQLAQAAGAHAQLSAERFSEFCSRDDLPAFDYIGMHGIWSWISADNREVLLDFLRRKLKPNRKLRLHNAKPLNPCPPRSCTLAMARWKHKSPQPLRSRKQVSCFAPVLATMRA